MEFEDIVILGSGHSLMGCYPRAVAEKVAANQELGMPVIFKPSDTQRFGLFDSSTPNYTTYYPDLNVEDLKPKDDEFIYPEFRLLSETIVHPKVNPIDFGKPGVLKASMPLLVGQTVNVDHETALGNAIGSVLSTRWDGESTINGLKVPPGINGVLKIDGKSNPRIARAVMMNPPAIHSNSVTVAFLWEQSHPEMDVNEFWSKLGSFDKDGNMIRRVVTKIKSYYETSLVNHGADPYAKLVGEDGKIAMPKHVKSMLSLSGQHEHDKNTHVFFIDYKNPEGTVQLSSSTPNNPNSSEITQNKMKKEQLLQLATLLGLAFTGETPEEFAAMVTNAQRQAVTDAVTPLNESISKKDTEIATLKTTIGEKDTEIATLKAGTGENAVEKQSFINLVDRGKRALGLLYKGEDLTKQLGLLEIKDFNALSLMITNFEADVEKKHPLTCQDCQSHNVSRASAAAGESGESLKAKRTTSDIHETLRNRKKGKSKA